MEFLILLWLLFLLWVAGLYFTLCKDTQHCATLLNWPKELLTYYRKQEEAQTEKPYPELAWGTDRGYCSGMAKKDPERMTAEEELQSLLKWAEQQRFENVAAALRRVLAKLPVS